LAAHANQDLLDAITSIADEFEGVGERPLAFSIEVVGARRGKNPLVRDATRMSGLYARNTTAPNRSSAAIDERARTRESVGREQPCSRPRTLRSATSGGNGVEGRKSA
jgi:hypothetical protein